MAFTQVTQMRFSPAMIALQKPEESARMLALTIQDLYMIMSGLPVGGVSDGRWTNGIFSGNVTFFSNGLFSTTLTQTDTANRTIQFPDKNGTVALLSDLSFDYSTQNKSGGTLYAGAAVAYHASGSGVDAALAADNTKNAIGIITEDVNNTFSGTIRMDGTLTLADWTHATGAVSLTLGPYYLDATTPGKITPTSPSITGTVSQVVGIAVTTDTLDVRPSNAFIN